MRLQSVNRKNLCFSHTNTEEAQRLCWTPAPEPTGRHAEFQPLRQKNSIHNIKRGSMKSCANLLRLQQNDCVAHDVSCLQMITSVQDDLAPLLTVIPPRVQETRGLTPIPSSPDLHNLPPHPETILDNHHLPASSHIWTRC